MFAKIVIKVIKLYQKYSWVFGKNICRFYPTCSQYMIEAIEKHGLVRGVLKGIGRIGRCHPWHPGGVDKP